MSRLRRWNGRRGAAGLRIAMVGQRGVPATYGGIERHVEEIGARLVELGHEVIVYCRPTYSGQRRTQHRGMDLVYLPTPSTKHLEAITHSAGATVAALRTGVDVIHYHALGPGLVAALPRISSSTKIVQTVHGLDHDRAKWGRTASAVLGLGAWTSARVPDATVVVSRALQAHYEQHYGRPTTYVCNGVDRVVEGRDGRATLDRFGLRAGGYVLFVGRLVPEKEPDSLIRAFRGIDRPDLRLVVAGGSSFTDRYEGQLRRLAALDPRVVLTGNLASDEVHELYEHAAVFVQPSSMEGMPLTLLEATAHGVPVLASDIAPHRELIGQSRPGARLFAHGGTAHLRDGLQAMLDDLGRERCGGREASDHIHDAYSWDTAARTLAELYRSLVGRPAAPMSVRLPPARVRSAPSGV